MQFSSREKQKRDKKKQNKKQKIAPFKNGLGHQLRN